jgi:hypothetical protein
MPEKPEEPRERIGDSEVIRVKQVGDFVIKRLAPYGAGGPIEPGSEEAKAIIDEVSRKLKVPRKLKTTIKPEYRPSEVEEE